VLFRGVRVVNWRSFFVRSGDSVRSPGAAVQLAVVTTATPPAPPQPPELRAPDERLHTVQAFRRFVARVTQRAGRWLMHRGVPPADRDDVLQEALLQAYKRREDFDPELGSWEDWAFAYVGRVVLNYRKVRARRIKRVDVAPVNLPDIAVDGPNAEEETEADMRQRLFERCMANLDDDSRAILLAKAEGRGMPAIAVALGVSLATAYRYHDAARAELQTALDREQDRKRALGVAVLPLTIDQLVASDSTTGHVTADAMGRIWRTLDRAMAADVKAGKLRDEGTEVPRCMGSPNGAPRPRFGARVLRALLDPRVSHALTGVLAAAGGAFVTYEIMRSAPPNTDSGAEVRAAASSTLARPVSRPDPAPTDTAASGTLRGSGAVEEPELHGPGAELRSDAGASPAQRDDIGEETAAFDKAKAAYRGGFYQEAILAFQDQARRYPRGQYAGMRERLLILSLIGAGRKREARQRIEQLRRANPESPTVKELEGALNPAN
jgi:RNA polymerase sigma factor (sigma-70 family)